jgi:hypothetical protein
MLTSKMSKNIKEQKSSFKSELSGAAAGASG